METRARDLAFELRTGEVLRNARLETAPYAVGLFPIPTPGPMIDMPDGSPSEGYKLTLAQRNGDKWQWMQFGAGTHAHLCDLLVDMPRGEWFGFTLETIGDLSMPTRSTNPA